MRRRHIKKENENENEKKMKWDRYCFTTKTKPTLWDEFFLEHERDVEKDDRY